MQGELFVDDLMQVKGDRTDDDVKVDLLELLACAFVYSIPSSLTFRYIQSGFTGPYARYM